MTDGPGTGWIKVHRELAAHRWWVGEPFSRGQAWLDLLLLANWQDGRSRRGSRVIDVRRGQLLTSLVSVSARWKRNRKTVADWLAAFEKDGMLAIETVYGPAGGYTLLTIQNFGRYQANGTAGPDSGSDSGSDSAEQGGTGQRIGQRTGQRSGQRSGQDLRSEEAKEGEGARARESSSSLIEEWNNVEPGVVTP